MSDLRSQLQATLGDAYTIDRELGGGGMSRVFVADEVRFKRKVVIKMLSPELMQGISAERFEREILLAASLQQANIVPVLSAGDSDGTPYFTMPYVDGESLRARLSRGPLSISETTSILRDVARALAYAHERGVVHRDIKPDNVLLSRGAAMVTDFGIAKAIVASATRGDRGETLTQLGTALGTPAYIAPEQAAGDPSTDHRADVYSFGCLAFELLTGRPPFDGRTPQKLLAAHMSETPQSVTDLRPEAPPELAMLVARCLEKEPSARPQTADALLAAVDGISAASGSRATLVIGERGATSRALAIYAAAFIAVAVLAKAAIVGIGLPDWVFPGAVGVMALGLPMILFTGYAQRVARRSSATNGTLAELAQRASPHLSWRRTTIGGAYAVGAFVLVVGGFMLLRAFGIGPAGSLLARGRFTERERVIVTDFSARQTDTSLGAVVSDAVRAALSQSAMISLVPPQEIAAALRLMTRPITTRLDLATARELALREGVKAVVDGNVTGVGAGYILTLRLVSADSGTQLASFQESGDGPRGLIDAADKVARQLRAKIGESLRNVQATPELARATTTSLEALRMYSLAARANTEEDPRASVHYVRRAVAIDSTFAGAWQLLAIALGNSGESRAEADSAIERAYRYRNRLPERERLPTEALYFTHGPHEDRSRALQAYLALFEHGDTASAPVNAGEMLRAQRAYARAESLNSVAIRYRGKNPGIAAGNAIELQLDQGNVRAAAKTLEYWKDRSPKAHGIQFHDLFVRYAQGDMAGVTRLADSLYQSGDATYRTWALDAKIALAILHGRLTESNRLIRELESMASMSDARRLADSVFRITVDAWFHGPSPGAVRALNAVTAQIPLKSLPLADRPYFKIANAYALAGDVDKASAIIAQYRRDVPDTGWQRIHEAELHSSTGAIALARGTARAAIDEFRRGDTTYDGLPSRECAACVHFELGRAFDAMGQADSTIAHYETYLAVPFWLKLFGGDNADIEFGDAMVLAGIEKRLGELYEAKGNRQKAASHYAAFVELWKDADPELRSKADEVRKRLARLSDTEAKR